MDCEVSDQTTQSRWPSHNRITVITPCLECDPPLQTPERPGAREALKRDGIGFLEHLIQDGARTDGTTELGLSCGQNIILPVDRQHPSDPMRQNAG